MVSCNACIDVALLWWQEQMTEREQEREEFQKEVEKLKAQLLNKEKQGDSQGRLHHEVAWLFSDVVSEL